MTDLTEMYAEKRASYRNRVESGQTVYARRPIQLDDFGPLDDGTLDKYGSPAWGHRCEPIIVPTGTPLIVTHEANAGFNGIVAWVVDPVTGLKAQISTGALTND